MSEAEKRSVNTDALATLGTIIGEGEKRDAIHLAVNPTVAKEKLFPGQDVGVDGTTKNPVGIVDPFLKEPIFPGQWFWLVVYPRQITSLRHVWSHPQFADSPQDEAKLAGERWLTEYASTLGVSRQEIIEHANDYLDSSEYWIEGGRFEGESVPEEFWDHYEAATGRKVQDGDRGSFFSCSC